MNADQLSRIQKDNELLEIWADANGIPKDPVLRSMVDWIFGRWLRHGAKPAAIVEYVRRGTEIIAETLGGGN